MTGEVEQALHELRQFQAQSEAMGSSHALSRVSEVLRQIETRYGKEAVKDYDEVSY
jgi:hypothetical protein